MLKSIIEINIWGNFLIHNRGHSEIFCQEGLVPSYFSYFWMILVHFHWWAQWKVALSVIFLSTWYSLRSILFPYSCREFWLDRSKRPGPWKRVDLNHHPFRVEGSHFHFCSQLEWWQASFLSAYLTQMRLLLYTPSQKVDLSLNSLKRVLNFKREDKHDPICFAQNFWWKWFEVLKI